MSEQDLGALSSALEVKPHSEPEPQPAASAGEGTENSRKGGDQDGDRKALNRASEALKEARKLKDQLAEMAGQNQQLVSLILKQQNGAQSATPKPEKPPYTQADISAMFSQGEYDKATLALEENNKFHRERDRAATEAATEAKIQQRAEGTELNQFLVKELGLGNEESDYVQAIDAEARKLMKRFPSLGKDPATAQVIAGMHVYKQAATGNLEFEDLRQESTERTQQASGTQQPTGIEPKVTVDWDAKNRGLPQAVVDKLNNFRLAHVLTKSDDPHQENVRRGIIADVLQHEKKVARRRKFG